MNRQTFMKSTLCLLMALVCNVAWAQTFVKPETGGYYKIKGTHSTNPWLTATVENGGIDVAANEADAAVYLRTENGLQAIATGKYIGTGGNGSQISLVDNEETVTIEEITGNNLVYIKTGGRYLYNNQPDYTREAGGLNAAGADAPKWGFIEQDAAEVLTTLKAIAVAHVSEHTAYLGTGIGYYSYVVGGAKTADPEAVKAAINAAATIEAVSAIVGTYAVNLPEFGKAYTMTFVTANKTEYKIIATDGTLEAKTEGESSVFYCLQSSSADYPYVFVSEDGYVMGYKSLVSTYVSTDNRHNFKVEAMVDFSSNITSSQADRLGLVCITTAARNPNDGSGGIGCLTIADSNGGWSNSSAPFHNGAHTSAIMMTEQADYTLTDAQQAKADEILGRTALKEQVEGLRGQLKNQVGYYYCTINGVKMYDADAILAAINAAYSAAAVAEIAEAVNAKAPVLPEYGKAYKMAFKTKAGVLHHIVANDATLALSASTTEEASVFYCMQSNSDEYPYIFVSAQGGFLTFKALSDAYISRVTDFKVGPMVDVANNVTSTVDVRLGTVYITTNKRPGSTDDTDGCFVFKNQGNANTYDGADVPFHNDNFTSAIVMTEVAAESKTIYDIVVDGDDDAQANAYVAYDNGTVVRKAFHNGYLVTDAALTEAQLKAAYVGNVVKSATITVEDNVITLADVVTFPTPVKKDLYNTSNGSLEVPPYRIPGITVDPETGRIITAAAELVCGTDPGYGEVDIVCRISDNNGDTWTDMIKVADGNGKESATENIFESAFGDPAIVADRTSSEVLVIAVAGCTVYMNGNTTRQNPNMIATIHSTDNGETWGKPVNVTEAIYSLFDSGNPIQSAFVGGGKIFQSRIVKVGQYYRLYAAMCARPNGNRVIYSDDFGRTWHALGGASALPAPGGDEPKCEEMPDGRVILSSRVGGGRIYNIYSYTNTLTAEGSWGTDVKSTFEGSGKTPGGNSTNGEILIVPVQRNSDQKEMYLALQSLPTGGGRSHVGIFYKELTDMTDINSVANFATDWNGFYLVTDKASAYSSMDLQADNRIGFIYEETLTGFGKVPNPVSTNFPNGEGTHNYDGYDNIYVAYPLEIITNGAYSIKREVSRRDYVSDYFTALAAEANKDVQNKVAAALDNLSDEPTIAEVDKLNYLLTLDSFWPSYSKTVTVGDKITDFSTIEDGQAVVFKLVSGNSYITINEDCNAGMSAVATGLSVFKMHRVGEGDTQTFSFESARKGYYFPELQNSGWPTYTMQKTDNPIAFEFLSQKSDGGTLGEGQFVVKSTTANAYFDGKADAFTGWQGKDANCAYEVWMVSPSEEKYYIGDFNFTVIDDLGNSYTGSSRGALGETPTSINFTGITGCTFKNEEWTDDNANYTANIVFPFPISNENITNATTISSFKNDTRDFFWYSDGTGIKAVRGASASSDNYFWAIYPYYNDGFTFAIKNVGTGKFINSVSNTNSHGDGAVTLNDEPSMFTVEVNNKFKLETGKYLSLNSTSETNAQTVGTWGDHGGTYNKFSISSPYHAVSAKIGNVGYATLYAPVALTVPEGLVAYTGLYNSDKTTLTLTPLAAGKTIPANTGVILAGAMGTYPFEKAEDAEAITDNVLTGTALGIATSSVTDGVVYTLQQDGEDVVFMEYTGVALAAGKAYLVLSEAAKSISIRFGEGTTSIDNGQLTIDNESALIYDLMGRRVEAITKGGIYIVNGKKVVVK